MRYVKLTFRPAEGKKKTVWAIKQRTGCYRQVNKEGEDFADGILRLILLAPADIVSEKIALMNNHYGELEV